MAKYNLPATPLQRPCSSLAYRHPGVGRGPSTPLWGKFPGFRPAPGWQWNSEV